LYYFFFFLIEIIVRDVALRDDALRGRAHANVLRVFHARDSRLTLSTREWTMTVTTATKRRSKWRLPDRPRARSGGKYRNAAARKDRLTAEVRGSKWFDVKNERSEQKGASETGARRRERDRARRRRKTPRERVEEATVRARETAARPRLSGGRRRGAEGIAGARSCPPSQPLTTPPRADHALGRLRLPSIALDRESRAV